MISWKILITVAICLLLGLIVGFLFGGTSSTEQTTFTTTELIGFLLSAMLSTASIVLAIAAIALGKSSENAVVSRSDESIRLQTELFAKTTEALQSIKASTGVTEKRIEDIIAGRAGEISKALAEDISQGKSVGSRDLEEIIRNSLATVLSETKETKNTEESDRELRRQRMLERDKARKIYTENHDKLLLSIINNHDVRVLKYGHGSPITGKDENFGKFDAVFTKAGRKIAISTIEPTFHTPLGTYGEPAMNELIGALASSVLSNDIALLYLVFFEREPHSKEMKAVGSVFPILNKEVAERIKIFNVDYDQVEEWAKGIEL